MQQLELEIRNEGGLHARPARVLVDLAKQFTSTIRVQHNNKHVNAKSMIALLTLGVACGQCIVVEVEGEDEVAAAAALTAAVRDGLGETPHGATAPAAEQLHGHPSSATQTTTAPPAASASNLADANIISGIPAAPGVAIGPIFQYRRGEVAISAALGDAVVEQTRLEHALHVARAQLATLHNQTLARAGARDAAIFHVHQDLIDDPELRERADALIAQGQSAAEAWKHATDEHAAALEQLSDTLLAERAVDVRDVGQRVLALLAGTQNAANQPSEPCIVVANDLTPSETASFDPTRILALCTAIGGPYAHTAILARALGLPAIVGTGSAVLAVSEGATAILDGAHGTLHLDPDQHAVALARAQQQAQAEARAAAALAAADPATTCDGHRVEIVANIGSAEEARRAVAAGAEGVGLLRTEFLFLERNAAPNENEQFAVYREVVQALAGRPVIIRTLDIGGDKPLPYLDLPHEENPFLGERGIRLCLAYPELLHQQLRAILRAASFGPVRVMFPMIADADELQQVRRIVAQLRSELGAPSVEIGIMVEIPAAALMADLLAAEVDFFSIGTNDLTQYTLAMDRTHPKLAAQADGLHPAVLRLIDRTVQAAHAAGKWVGVCGELAADPRAVPILVGLGVDELSVSAPAIATVKAQIRGLSLVEARERAAHALGCATAKEVREGVSVA